MTNIYDLDLNLPWDFDAPAVPASQKFRPLEEYTAFLEDIGALRAGQSDTKVFEEPFTL